MVKILHLYPHLMNLYGDYANVIVLKKHLEDQGLKVSITSKEIDDKFKLQDYDFIYMGSGTESNLEVALKDIKKHKKELEICIDEKKTILFTGNAMELLGKHIDNEEALDLFDFETKHTDKRYTGDIIARNDEFGFVVGFVNKSTVIKRSEEEKLFDYVFTDNNLKDSSFEGYRRNNLFATHIIGPVLVKNPSFMETMVRTLLPERKKYKNIEYKYESDSYTVTLNALKERFK